jgi:hypothetical protein
MTEFPDTFAVVLHDGQSAIVDEADRHVVSGVSWSAIRSGNKTYAAHVDRINGKSVTTYMHRLIKGAATGQPVDHKNGDSLDNRRLNLRAATHAQNMQNVGITKANTSGYKGVNWNSAAGKWHARIRVSGKRFHLGLFETAEDAHAAYTAAALKYHGEFANTENRISRIEKAFA